MSNSKRRRKRRGRGRTASRKGGGVLLGMRSGFKGVAGAMTGEGHTGKHEQRARWLGRIVTVLLLAAAIGLLAQRL